MRCPVSIVAPSTRALHIGKGFSGPSGIKSTPTGQQPDLKYSQTRVGVVVFAMANSPAGGDHLHPPVRGVALAIDSKVVPRLEPVAICTSKGVQSSQLQHRSHLADRACGAPKARDQGG